MSAITRNISEPIYENGIWKGAKIDSPEGHFKFGERLLSQLKNYPDFVGQIDGATGEAETYKSMAERSIRCAIWLQKQGITQGDVIGLCAKSHLNSSIPLFASLYLGTIINPWWNFNMNEEKVIKFIKASKPRILFVDENDAEIVLETINKRKYSLPVVIFGKKSGLLSFRDILETIRSDEVDQFECAKVEAKHAAVLWYTSGTTDSPKLVLHSYRSITNMMNHYHENNSKSSTYLGFVPFFGLIRLILRSVLLKATMILSNYNKDEIEESCKLIEKYKVTRLIMTVFVFHVLCEKKAVWEYDMSSVNHVTFGSGIIKSKAVETVSRLFKNADFFSYYGSTEFGVLLLGKSRPNKINSSGKVFLNAEVKVIDLKTGNMNGPNEKGELLCRISSLMSCYWNNPIATDRVIDSEGWFRTGDLGYYDSDGDFFVVDRISELLRIPGHHFSPAVIEEVIQELPGVAEVAVVAHPSSKHYDIPMAFVTKAPGMVVTRSDIHEIVENKLPSAMRLQGGVRFLEKLPYTPMKIDKPALRRMAKAFVEK